MEEVAFWDAGLKRGSRRMLDRVLEKALYGGMYLLFIWVLI